MSSSTAMKLITNENNIDALKILIAANEVEEQLTIEYGNAGCLVPRLVTSGDSPNLSLFVANSACVFILHQKKVAKDIRPVEGM